MATPIGVDTVTSIARRYIMPTITDQIYPANVIFYRLHKANKKLIQGGTQIEVPSMFRRFAAGGAYRGFDPLDTTPSDTIRSGALDWKQYYVPWSLSGLTLIQTDSPEAIANFLTLQSQQAFMEMGENLAFGLFQNGVTNPKELDGFPGFVGNASVGNVNYAGIARSANPWWNGQIDAASSTLSLASIHALIMSASRGGQHPTILMSRQEQYNRAWALGVSANAYEVQFNRAPGGHDELLLSAGFTNIMVDNIPLVVDPHVDNGPNASNSKIYAINENTLHLVVSPRADFFVEDFQKPINQDAMVSMILWAGNVICTAPNLNAAMTNVSA
jgi:hypothetical protein